VILIFSFFWQTHTTSKKQDVICDFPITVSWFRHEQQGSFNRRCQR